MKRAVILLVAFVLVSACVEIGVDTDKDFYALNKNTAVDVTAFVTSYSGDPGISYNNGGIVEVKVYKLPGWKKVASIYGPKLVVLGSEDNLKIQSTWHPEDQDEGLYVTSISWYPAHMLSTAELGPHTCVDLFLLGPSTLGGDAKRAFKALELGEQKCADTENLYRLVEYAVASGQLKGSAKVDLSEFGLGTRTVNWILDAFSPHTGSIYAQKETLVLAEDAFTQGDYNTAFSQGKQVKDNLLTTKNVLMEALEQNGLGKGDIKDIGIDSSGNIVFRKEPGRSIFD